METRIIIAGSRGFSNYELLRKSVLEHINLSDDIVIVSGTAKGADQLGEKFASEYNLKLKQMPANWDLLGKSAGYIRNKDMAEFASKGNGILIAFWDGKSHGTMNMIKLAKQYGLIVHVINYKEGCTDG